MPICVTIRYCEGIQWQIIKQVVVVVVMLMNENNEKDNKDENTKVEDTEAEEALHRMRTQLGLYYPQVLSTINYQLKTMILIIITLSYSTGSEQQAR